MLTIANNLVCFFDVDDTLILWEYDPNLRNTITIRYPLSNGGEYIRTFQVHTEHVERIKDLKLKGETIIVWSQGGYDWAERVVTALGLKDFVDVCMTKPSRAYDDCAIDTFIQRRYIPVEKCYVN